MLNISVAPQIKSSTENPAAIISSGSTSTKEPIAEEFGKVLEREVSEATIQHETDGNASTAQEHSESATSSENTETTSTVATTTDGANSFIQDLFINAGNAYKTDQSLRAMGGVFSPDTMIATSVVPLVLPTSSQNTLTSLDTKQIPSSAIPITLTSLDAKQISGSTIPISNQLLQQSPAQPNLVASSSTSLSNNLWQSLDMADSAAYGEFLPFSSKMSEDIRMNAGESTLSTHDESISSHSFSLSNSFLTTSLNTTSQDIHIDLPVGQPKWGGEFVQKIVWLTSQQHQVAEIRLNPAHLGPVEVTLSITQDQATAQFSSPHLAVREAIEQALPRLREMMAENGIQLGDVMVGADSFQRDNRQHQAYHSAKDANNMAGARPEIVDQIETTVLPSRHRGIVNTYA